MLRRRARALALLLAGWAWMQPAASQPDSLRGYAYRRIEVTSGSRIPDSLADRVRDAAAARLAANSGIPATVKISILDARNAPDGMHLFAIVTVTETATQRILTEFDAEATTPPTPLERESLMAEALADSIAAVLAARQ